MSALRGLWPLRSMRARMTVWLAAAIALVMLVFGSLWLGAQSRAMDHGYRSTLSRAAEAVISAKTPAEIGTRLDQLNDRDEENEPFAEEVAAWLTEPNQDQFIWRQQRRFGRGPRPPQPLDNGIPPLFDRGGWRSIETSWRGKRLILGMPFRRSADALRMQALALLGIGLLATGATAFGAYVLVGKTLAPIDELATQTRLAAQNPTQLLAISDKTPLFKPTSSDAEMVHLVGTFNDFLAEMRESVLSKERFHTAASHELRTPLQALSGHLQVALSRPREAEEYRLAIEEAARQTERLSKLTQDLLLLNRIQTAATIPQHDSVDVSEICDIALQRAEKTMEARGLQLVEKLESFQIDASMSHLEILLGNLVENAAKYSKTGGEIGVEIELSKRQVIVWNECEPQTSEQIESEAERLFEPFYRPDASRHSSTGGNGLGLAICRAIAEANGWKLTIYAAKDESRVSVCVKF